MMALKSWKNDSEREKKKNVTDSFWLPNTHRLSSGLKKKKKRHSKRQCSFSEESLSVFSSSSAPEF